MSAKLHGSAWDIDGIGGGEGMGRTTVAKVGLGRATGGGRLALEMRGADDGPALGVVWSAEAVALGLAALLEQTQAEDEQCDDDGSSDSDADDQWQVVVLAVGCAGARAAAEVATATAIAAECQTIGRFPRH